MSKQLYDTTFIGSCWWTNLKAKVFGTKFCCIDMASGPDECIKTTGYIYNGSFYVTAMDKVENEQ